MYASQIRESVVYLELANILSLRVADVRFKICCLNQLI